MPSKVPGPFVNLHVHTDKSILDGFSHIHDLARLAAEDGAPALALTDHKNISNTIQLFHACEKYGIKAIPGLEAHFFPEIAKYKNRAGTGQKSRYHSVILAKSDQGYKNLVKITSIMHDSKHRFGLYPMADFELFDTYSKGLIGTTACIGGLSNQLILQGDEKGAYDAVSKFVDIFGKENFFIELQNHGIPEEKKLIPELMRMSKKMKLKTIVTGDSHYDTKADARAHDALLAINSGSSIDDPNRFRFHGSNNYYHTAALAYKLFPEKDFPGAVSNTLLVADMVNVSDPSKVDPILPKYPFLGKYKSDTEMLRAMCEDGLRRMFSDPSGRVRQEYRDRVEEELGVIEPKGFPSYFLFLSDICMWLKSRGIPLGPGRGSAAGSLVALLVGITNVDPIPHGLFFSRFLNADREGLPDIDIDIDATRRQEVIDYMKEHFGEEQCAQICSWGTLKALSSIDDSNRVLGGKVSDAEYVKSLYPAIKEVPKLKILLSEEEPEKAEHLDAWNMASKMREEYESDSHYGEVIELASELEGSIKSIGRHAAGILITPGEVSDYFPIFEASEDSGLPRSQYDKYDIEEAGGLKLDLLSLSNLSVIDRACQLIRLETGKEVDPWNLPMNDPATFKMLAAGETGAVFQVSREGITKLLVLMNINSFDQLVAAVALYRPGPMGVNAHLDFAKRATGKQKITSLHPKFTEILSDTYALIVYQEQVMLVSQVFAGFTGVEADNFRRAMGKKKPEVMAKEHEKFVSGCVANGYSEKLGRDIWDIIEPFAGYAFNKSHSVAYAYVTLATAYLKRHYPSQFLAAYIDSSFFSSKPEEFARLLSYATEQGVRVLPPNINVSSSEATTLENTVYIGIGRVSGCNAKATKAIISNRSTYGPFASLSDFIERLQGTAVSKNAVYGLIHSGAFDELHDSRLAMSEAVEDMFNIAKSVHNSIDSAEDSAFNIFDFADEDDVPTKAIEEFDLTGDDYTVRERRSHEFAAIGMFAGSHPFEDFKPLIPQLIELERIPKNAVPASPDVLEDYIGKVVSMYGIVGGLEQKVAKKSKREYTKFRIETQMGRSIESVVWGLTIDDEERGSLAVVTGKVTEKTRETFDENGDSEGIERYIEFSARSFETVDTDISERRQRKARLSIVDGGDKKRERREQRVRPSRDDLQEKKVERFSRTKDKPRTSRLKESSRTETSSRSRSKSSSENVVSLPTLNRVTFIVEKQRDLQKLQKKLDLLEEGSVHVYVTFSGERYDLGNSFALSRKDVTLIEEELGIRVRLPQINRSSRRK